MTLHTRFLITVLLVCALLVPSCSAQGTAESAVQEIGGLLRQNQPDQALLAAQGELRRDPRNCAASALGAIALEKLNRNPDAVIAFKKTIHTCPNYLPGLEGAAELEYAVHDPDNVSVLRQLLAVDPQNALAHAMLAFVLQETKGCQAASLEFAAAAALFSARPDLVQAYASCLVEDEHYDRALQLYETLPAVSGPAGNALRYNIALLQWKLGSARDAMATLDPLLQAKYPPALALASGMKEEEGDTPAAVEMLRLAIAQEPENVENYLDFAVISFRHSSFEAGIAMLNAGLKELPNSSQLFVARAVLEIQLSQNREALEDLRRGHELNPQLSIVADAMGMMRVQARDSKAASFFEDEAHAHPQDAFLQFLLAERLSRDATSPQDRSFEEAIDAAQQAVRLKADYVAAHDILAQLYVRAGRFADAENQSEIASRLDPQDETAIYQQILARRHNSNDPEFKRLVAKLQAVRQQNAERKAVVDRYRLQPAAEERNPPTKQ